MSAIGGPFYPTAYRHDAVLERSSASESLVDPGMFQNRVPAVLDAAFPFMTYSMATSVFHSTPLKKAGTS